MLKVQYGAGPKAFAGWRNYDASPTLVLQRLPLAGAAFRRALAPRFDDAVVYGDIAARLPLADNSVRYLYCSHVLEHLALADFRAALGESLRVLEPGGIFRGVLPDIEVYARRYLSDRSVEACSSFMRATFLGQERRPRGISGLLRAALGNSRHRWMWDYKGLSAELERAGFASVRRAEFGDSAAAAFAGIEEEDRWTDGLGFECINA